MTQQWQTGIWRHELLVDQREAVHVEWVILPRIQQAESRGYKQFLSLVSRMLETRFF